jgi:drug/metabolite transporter (DMT)-like permease
MAPWLYVAILWGVGAGGLAIVAWLRPRVANGAFALPPMAFDARKAVAGGLMTLGAYLLVLFALSRAEVALVGPLRESSVLLTSAWGILRLREAAGRQEIALRLTGSLMVVAGVLVLAIAG